MQSLTVAVSGHLIRSIPHHAVVAMQQREFFLSPHVLNPVLLFTAQQPCRFRRTHILQQARIVQLNTIFLRGVRFLYLQIVRSDTEGTPSKLPNDPGIMFDNVPWLAQMSASAQMIEVLNLPKTSMMKFTGDPLGYNLFMNTNEFVVSEAWVEQITTGDVIKENKY